MRWLDEKCDDTIMTERVSQCEKTILDGIMSTRQNTIFGHLHNETLDAIDSSDFFVEQTYSDWASNFFKEDSDPLKSQCEYVYKEHVRNEASKVLQGLAELASPTANYSSGSNIPSLINNAIAVLYDKEISPDFVIISRDMASSNVLNNRNSIPLCYDFDVMSGKYKDLQVYIWPRMERNIIIGSARETFCKVLNPKPCAIKTIFSDEAFNKKVDVQTMISTGWIVKDIDVQIKSFPDIVLKKDFKNGCIVISTPS